MQLLWIATKPPEPASDGGRLAMLLTLEVLAREAVETTLVAPVSTGTGVRDLEEALDRTCRALCQPFTVRGSTRASTWARVSTSL
jgi:hypothetical protein